MTTFRSAYGWTVTGEVVGYYVSKGVRYMWIETEFSGLWSVAVDHMVADVA